jgi:hypothetical protein
MIVSLSGPFATLGPVANAILWTLVLCIAFVGSMAIVAFFLVRLPATYFVDDDRKVRGAGGRVFLSWTALILKNLLGAVLVGVGAVMLFTPGQGILTILIGIMLLNFPGKRRLERKLVARPRVLDAINRLRARFARPPLVIEKGQHQTVAPRTMSDR